MTRGGSFKRAVRREHPEPVSSYRGQQVLVTGYVDGVPGPNTPDHVRRLADALGRLHSTSLDGRTIRDGGAWGHDPAHDRLAEAMRLQPAYYAAWGYWQAVAAGRPPVGSARWWPDRRATDAIAERVVGRLTDGEPER